MAPLIGLHDVTFDDTQAGARKELAEDAMPGPLRDMGECTMQEWRSPSIEAELEDPFIPLVAYFPPDPTYPPDEQRWSAIFTITEPGEENMLPDTPQSDLRRRGRHSQLLSDPGSFVPVRVLPTVAVHETAGQGIMNLWVLGNLEACTPVRFRSAPPAQKIAHPAGFEPVYAAALGSS